jgi:hypothetical protein
MGWHFLPSTEFSLALRSTMVNPQCAPNSIAERKGEGFANVTPSRYYVSWLARVLPLWHRGKNEEAISRMPGSSWDIRLVGGAGPSGELGYLGKPWSVK